MKIFLIGNYGYLEMGEFMLCLGEKKEVLDADDKQLVEMIYQAIAISNYRDISKTKVAH